MGLLGIGKVVQAELVLQIRVAVLPELADRFIIYAQEITVQDVGVHLEA